MPKGRGKETMRDVMHRFKHGQLHSGSKKGPKVKNRKQAIAIGLSEAGGRGGKGRSKAEKRLKGKTV